MIESTQHDLAGRQAPTTPRQYEALVVCRAFGQQSDTWALSCPCGAQLLPGAFTPTQGGEFL